MIKNDLNQFRSVQIELLKIMLWSLHTLWRNAAQSDSQNLP